MRTGEELYHYAASNGYGTGVNEKWGIKHFSIIAEHLLPDETVLMTFIGLHNYESMTKHDSNFAYAITDKRIIMAQKHTFSGEKLQTVSLNNINDITLKSGIALGVMTIDTTREKFNVGLDKKSAKAIMGKVSEVLNEIKSQSAAAPISQPTAPTSASHIADDILKFKQLMDAGTITPEEFEAKKKQLLGL